MKFIKILSLISILTIIIYSCEGIKTLSSIYATEAEYDEYSNDIKTIRFIGMIHISTKEFYADVVKKITEAKKDNYVLFYEHVDLKSASDTDLRKFRKMIGVSPTIDGYKKKIDELEMEGVVAQENSQFLNLINDKDFIVDVSVIDLIEEYEKRYGDIKLDSVDKETPLEEPISVSLPQENTTSILIDYRNQYLARKIENSEYSKIIVLYGMIHEKGLIKELQKLDQNWKISANTR